MAKKLNKLRSLDEGEIILEEVPESEVVAWSDPEPVGEPKDEPLEIKVSTNEPSQADIVWAKANLTGYPRTFEGVSIEFLERLCRQGIAANFGVEGYARGFKFHAI